MTQSTVGESGVRRITDMKRLATQRHRGRALGLLAAMLLGLSGAGVGDAAPGDLDPTFGSGGIGVSFGPLDWASALVQQPDGKLIVAGTSANDYILLTRYLPDGRVDTSFGPGGKVTTAVRGHATCVACYRSSSRARNFASGR
jgi:hypothetical protein